VGTLKNPISTYTLEDAIWAMFDSIHPNIIFKTLIELIMNFLKLDLEEEGGCWVCGTLKNPICTPVLKDGFKAKISFELWLN